MHTQIWIWEILRPHRLFKLFSQAVAEQFFCTACKGVIQGFPAEHGDECYLLIHNHRWFLLTDNFTFVKFKELLSKSS